MAQYETSPAAPELQAAGENLGSLTDDRRRPDADLAHDYEELAPADAIAAIVLLSTLLLGVIGLVGWTMIN